MKFNPPGGDSAEIGNSHQSHNIEIMAGDSAEGSLI